MAEICIQNLVPFLPPWRHKKKIEGIVLVLASKYLTIQLQENKEKQRISFERHKE